jgi:CRP/FNR family cyclic AMP-dependent transcriptional regulator
MSAAGDAGGDEMNSDNSENWPRGSLLAHFSPAARIDVLSRGTLVELPPGTRFLRQGEMATEVFILVNGLVKVTADTADGESALLAIRVAGDAVGELASLDGLPRLASVTSAGLVRARRISGAEFGAFLQEHPQAAVAVSRSVSAKLRWATRRRIEFGA